MPDQETAYVLSKCIVCGCCLEACPQFLKIEAAYRRDETPEQYDARRRAAEARGYVGRLRHRPGGVVQFEPDRKDAGPAAVGRAGGRRGDRDVQLCAELRQVCPKEIPLTTAIARQGRAATRHVLRRWLDG